MSLSQSLKTLTPDQSEAAQELDEDFSEDTADWSAEDSAHDPAGQRRRKKTTLNQEIVCRFLTEFNKPKRPSVNVIAAAVGISESAAKIFVRKILDGDYDCGNKIPYRPKKNWGGSLCGPRRTRGESGKS